MEQAQTKPSSIDELVTAEGLTRAAKVDAANTFLYRDDVSRYIRGLETADEKTLAEHGVAGGKINGRVLYEKLNSVARQLIGKHLIDSEHWNWIPNWEDFQALVERLSQQGKYTHDLATQLEALYTGTANSYRGQRNIGRTRAAPLDAAKGHTTHVAEDAGLREVFDSAIKGARDASGVVRIKSQIEGPFAEKMGQIYATKGYAGIVESAKRYATEHTS